MAKTKDPLAPFIEHHPILMLGAALLFGTAVGQVLGSAAVDIQHAVKSVKSNGRGEYGKKEG